MPGPDVPEVTKRTFICILRVAPHCGPVSEVCRPSRPRRSAAADHHSRCEISAATVTGQTARPRASPSPSARGGLTNAFRCRPNRRFFTVQRRLRTAIEVSTLSLRTITLRPTAPGSPGAGRATRSSCFPCAAEPPQRAPLDLTNRIDLRLIISIHTRPISAPPPHEHPPTVTRYRVRRMTDSAGQKTQPQRAENRHRFAWLSISRCGQKPRSPHTP